MALNMRQLRDEIVKAEKRYLCTWEPRKEFYFRGRASGMRTCLNLLERYEARVKETLAELHSTEETLFEIADRELLLKRQVDELSKKIVSLENMISRLGGHIQ